jgi:uncharacterized repeat protein (TIGR01451 family)
MRRKLIPILTTATAGLALMTAASASAVTIGSTTQPAGSGTGGCGSNIIGSSTSDPTLPFMVPVGGGEVTGWSVNTTSATPGASVTFLVLRRVGNSHIEVIGTDPETLPNPLPAGNVASFLIASPITANAGDTLGIYASGGGLNCFFSGGSTLATNVLFALTPSGTPAPGQLLSQALEESPIRYQLNASATVIATEDAGVTTGAGPVGATAGSPVVLTSSVTNYGPETAPITFTDPVPAGLTIKSATLGATPCTVVGQTAICTITALAPGQSMPVVVSAVPAATGTYTNTVSVQDVGVHDPNPANNSATATLAVGPATTPTPTPASCVVPSLARTPTSVAEQVINRLGCRVGKITKAHSGKVPKGTVIRTSPGAGTYAPGTTVDLTVSGNVHKHHKHKGRRSRGHGSARHK